MNLSTIYNPLVPGACVWLLNMTRYNSRLCGGICISDAIYKWCFECAIGAVQLMYSSHFVLTFSGLDCHVCFCMQLGGVCSVAGISVEYGVYWLTAN